MKTLLTLLAILSFTACGRPGAPPAAPPQTETALLQVNGMTCDNCVQGISGTLKQLPGIGEFAVSLEDATAQISYNPKVLNPEQIAHAISRLGFQATVLTPSAE